jgi:hypothetical protein
MRKIVLGLLMVLVLGCTKDEDKVVEKAKDCGCNKVVEVRVVNIVGSINNPGNFKYYYYTTINECTGIQRDGSSGQQFVAVGDCR